MSIKIDNWVRLKKEVADKIEDPELAALPWPSKVKGIYQPPEGTFYLLDNGASCRKELIEKVTR